MESCHELDVSSWELRQGVLHVELHLPTHTCVTELFAIYSETRDGYKPKPPDVESNRLAVQVEAVLLMLRTGNVLVSQAAARA